MRIESQCRRVFAICVAFVAVAISTATSLAAEPSEQHAAFIEALRELDQTNLATDWQRTVGLKASVKHVSKPRAFRPKIVFDGWYIDSGGQHSETSNDALVDSLMMAQTPAASSYWQLVETDQGYLIVASAGPQKGRLLAVDESVKTRPEGADLLVSECLRLSSKVTPSSFWRLTHTEDGVVVELLGGKYQGWCWDFAGGAQSFTQGDREVAKNVLLAEREVAGSYYDVEPQR